MNDRSILRNYRTVRLTRPSIPSDRNGQIRPGVAMRSRGLGVRTDQTSGPGKSDAHVTIYRWSGRNLSRAQNRRRMNRW